MANFTIGTDHGASFFFQDKAFFARHLGWLRVSKNKHRGGGEVQTTNRATKIWLKAILGVGKDFCGRGCLCANVLLQLGIYDVGFQFKCLNL